MKKSYVFLLIFMGMISNLYSADIRSLEDKIDKLSEEVANIKTEIIISEDKVSFFDLSKETSIDKINTNAGSLYLKITDIIRSGDGYKARVHIGNPLFATFSQMTINYTWRSSNEWVKRSVDVQEPLAPSAWTTTEITLSPVRSQDELTAFLMSIDIGSVELLNK